ncbi:uncharacterized protein K452DRAFT_78317 [Aplosporella prunicola CBS 121167]|uniref:Uncharacterized protein n=1 Tax=Aplosporella prunicola CBS 121167 TaxID=1176127 RepID=A0A6A6B825_9PEZI|nr:uncharacterized protein K452DRAFT_78317 [Aplosporella prunicola CBS 121167]KAF2138941.1 hypothetical protein K452DRAFT_78317 [Aplosporella prunicola CBS 121167]
MAGGRGEGRGALNQSINLARPSRTANDATQGSTSRAAEPPQNAQSCRSSSPLSTSGRAHWTNIGGRRPPFVFPPSPRPTDRTNHDADDGLFFAKIRRPAAAPGSRPGPKRPRRLSVESSRHRAVIRRPSRSRCMVYRPLPCCPPPRPSQSLSRFQTRLSRPRSLARMMAEAAGGKGEETEETRPDGQ